MSSPVPNKDTVRGHGLVVGDHFDFYGMGNAGIPTEEGIRCQVGKVGNGYMLTTVSGDLDTFEFGAASKIYGFKVDTDAHTVTVSEHGMGDAVAYRAECSHGWQTGYHVTAQDATDVALGHGTVSRPLYEAPQAPVYTALNPAPYAQHKGHKMNLAGTHRGNRVCLDCGTIPVGVPDETPAVRDTPQVPTLTSAQTDAMIVFVDYPDGLTESDYKYASVRKITVDALVRNGMLRCDMWAGRGQVYTLDTNGLVWRDARNREGVASMSAAQRAITYPTVKPTCTVAGCPGTQAPVMLLKIATGPSAQHANDSYFCGPCWGGWKNSTQLGNVVKSIPLTTVEPAGALETRQAAIALVEQNRRVFVDEVESFGMLPDTFAQLAEEGRLTLVKDGASSRYILAGWPRKTQAEVEARHAQLAAVTDSDPDTVAEVNTERMMAAIAPLQGDWVYRAADAQQGRITYTLGDSVQVAWLDGGLQRLDVSALLAMGFEIVPAAEVELLKELGGWHTPSRPVKAGTDTMLAPMRTKLNKRKRNIAKRNRRSPRGRR